MPASRLPYSRLLAARMTAQAAQAGVAGRMERRTEGCEKEVVACGVDGRRWGWRDGRQIEDLRG